MAVEGAEDGVDEDTQDADGGHADEYQVGAQDFHAVGDEVAETHLRRHQFGGNDGGPARTEGNAQADDDGGHGGGQDHLAEQGLVRIAAQHLAGPDQHRVHTLHAGNGVQQDGEEGRDKDNEYFP